MKLHFCAKVTTHLYFLKHIHKTVVDISISFLYTELKCEIRKKGDNIMTKMRLHTLQLHTHDTVSRIISD